MRTITLPNGRAVTLGDYVRAWQTVRDAEPEQQFSGFGSWDRVLTAAEILQAMRRGLHERITEAVPYTLRGLVCHLPPKGRKWDPDWQREARHCAREVNTPRLIVRWVPRDFALRLAHRVSSPDFV